MTYFQSLVQLGEFRSEFGVVVNQLLVHFGQFVQVVFQKYDLLALGQRSTLSLLIIVQVNQERRLGQLRSRRVGRGSVGRPRGAHRLSLIHSAGGLNNGRRSDISSSGGTPKTNNSSASITQHNTDLLDAVIQILHEQSPQIVKRLQFLDHRFL